MPRGDRTGPEGLGPMTGRAAGYCTGNDMPGFANFYPGRGFGRELGFGRGQQQRFGWNRRYWSSAPFYDYPADADAYYPSKKDELEHFKQIEKDFQKSLKEVQDRISKLQTEKE
ncbi:hypothetical protein ES708_08061 [subsurface metagenome]